jgi:hypothetical protein
MPGWQITLIAAIAAILAATTVRAENLVHVMRPGGFVDQATGVSLPSDAVPVEIDRFG